MLHIAKLAVGATDVADLRRWQEGRIVTNPPLRHLTRNFPRRAPEVCDGGSMYWVVAGAMVVRQRILDIIEDSRDDGSRCAAIVLDPELIAVAGRPTKAFQGWRYLAADDAPPDLAGLQQAAGVADLPPEMASALRGLGLI
jgi:hypothetical protein